MSTAEHASQIDASASVRAPLNFVPRDYLEKSYVMSSAGRPYENEVVQVAIEDEGPRRSQLSLEREGFILVPFVSAIKDYTDRDQLSNIWRREVEDVLKELTGADHIITFAYTTRHSLSDPTAKNAGMAAPARYVHSDWGPNQFKDGNVTHGVVKAELERIMGDRQPRKLMPYNVWSAISPPPFDNTLALCDARTVSEEDYVLTYFQANTADSSAMIEVPAYRYNPRQRWVFFPDMQNELLIFSGLDPDVGPTWQMVPHTAFDNPDCPPGSAAPRQNAELRAVAVFE